MVVIDKKYKWKTIKFNTYVINYIGCIEELTPIFQSIDNMGDTFSHENIDELLDHSMPPGAVIMESSKYIIAFVDHVRCYPIFYTNTGDFIISNSARKLRNLIKNKRDYSFDERSLKEFTMSGYVTGYSTLIRGLNQFQSGERLILIKEFNSLDVKRYYRYTPQPDLSKSDDEWIEELDVVMNNVTMRMIDRADNRPIRVTLSAGLDSRVLVCKLHEFKYKFLECFSYGPKWNWEAKGARKVAKRLNIPWSQINLSHKESHNLFWKLERNKYWKFSDGLSSLANYQEYLPLSAIKNNCNIPSDAILINGQSGDFITGGHIPKSLLMQEADIDTMLNEIIKKHYSLWKNLLTVERLGFIKRKILNVMGINAGDNLSNDELIVLYEQWEYEERQVKWVVQGQRAQDFFGYDWQMPLWDIELVKFYEKVPVHLKIDQNLYKMWLKKWNYEGLFVDFNPVVWRWPGLSIIVVPMAKIIGFLLGKKTKSAWYELFYYWGHGMEHYAPYSYYEYFKLRKKIRNFIPLHMKTWFKENKVSSNFMD
jgi:asparagine synthase (glutamine-hydrolysing)